MGIALDPIPKSETTFIVLWKVTLALIQTPLED